MTAVSHGKPYAGNPHVRFEEGASESAKPSRKALLPSKDVFVVRHGTGWAVRRPGTDRVSKAFETKAPAFAYGRNMARAGHGELRVQNLNGQFGTCNSYGHDSCPPHDKNR